MTHKFPIESEDIEEGGSLADRLLFWLLKHPCQRMSDLAFVFQVDGSTIWRHLRAFVAQECVESMTAAMVAPNRPEVLYYLTTRGIARVADLVGGADPAMLARMWHANESELLRLLPRLHSCMPLQDVVQGLIAEAPRLLAYPGGSPAAIRWHWQREYVHAFQRGKKHLRCRTDGAVVFRRRPFRRAEGQDDTESWHCFLLLMDPGFRGSEDVRLIRDRLEHLLLWRESSERWPIYHAFPPLLVLAPTPHQRDLWRECAREAAAHLRVAPFKGACATLDDGSPWRFSWQHLDGSGFTSLLSLAEPLVPQAIPPGLLAPKAIAPLAYRDGSPRERPVVLGHFETRAKCLDARGADLKKTEEIAFLSLRLGRRHRDLLEQIYASPLMAPSELAAVMRMEPSTVRRYLYDLRDVHCVETISTVRGKRLTVSEPGLRLIAAMQGVPLIHLAEKNDAHWRQRGVTQSLRTLEHTAGIYTFLAQLQRQAWKLGQEVLWWETSRSLRRYRYQGAWHNLMPDALFAYRGEEASLEAWLEWDTGSMHRQPLRTKCAAYALYLRSHQYRREHLTPPLLLLIAPQNTRERYLTEIAASVLGRLPLTIWTTTEPLLRVKGPLAAIWRKVDGEQKGEESACRTTWCK